MRHNLACNRNRHQQWGLASLGSVATVAGSPKANLKPFLSFYMYLMAMVERGRLEESSPTGSPIAAVKPGLEGCRARTMKTGYPVLLRQLRQLRFSDKKRHKNNHINPREVSQPSCDSLRQLRQFAASSSPPAKPLLIEEIPR